jgi:hypothetical protein
LLIAFKNENTLLSFKNEGVLLCFHSRMKACSGAANLLAGGTTKRTAPTRCLDVSITSIHMFPTSGPFTAELLLAPSHRASIAHGVPQEGASIAGSWLQEMLVHCMFVGDHGAIGLWV